MRFEKSTSMKISLLPEQEGMLSSKEKIEKACERPDVWAYDIYHNDLLIGFVLVRQFEDTEYFLWDYAIDCKYQNQGYGTVALREFIPFMQREHGMKTMTTTYIWGNDHAKYIYEKLGFVETDVVDEEDCHEVNMIYHCD